MSSIPCPVPLPMPEVINDHLRAAETHCMEARRYTYKDELKASKEIALAHECIERAVELMAAHCLAEGIPQW